MAAFTGIITLATILQFSISLSTTTIPHDVSLKSSMIPMKAILILFVTKCLHSDRKYLNGVTGKTGRIYSTYSRRTKQEGGGRERWAGGAEAPQFGKKSGKI